MAKKKKVIVIVDDDLHLKARLKSVQTNTTIAEVVRGCLKNWTRDVVIPPEKSGG